jgi:WD40 repeat protein
MAAHLVASTAATGAAAAGAAAGAYPLQLATASGAPFVAVGFSDGALHLVSRDSLATLSTLRASPPSFVQPPITGVAVGASAVAASSADGIVAVFDTRTPPSATLTLTPFARSAVGACSCALADVLLAAGSEATDAGDAWVALYDVRAARKPVRTYEEAHTGDVMQCSFAATVPPALVTAAAEAGSDATAIVGPVLLTAGMDGLVCAIDAGQDTEDDAYLAIGNADASVSHAGWFGPACDYVYALTHDEKLVLLSADGGFLAQHPHLCAALPGASAVGGASAASAADVADMAVEREVEYVVDCCFMPDSGRLVAIGGNHSGRLVALNVGISAVQPLGPLQCGHAGVGHTTTVRCAAVSNELLYSGAEDGSICAWRMG